MKMGRCKKVEKIATDDERVAKFTRYLFMMIAVGAGIYCGAVVLFVL